MKTKKGPKFVKRDDKIIKAYEDNGGLSESTKLARKSAVKVFNECQEINVVGCTHFLNKQLQKKEWPIYRLTCHEML